MTKNKELPQTTEKAILVPKSAFISPEAGTLLAALERVRARRALASSPREAREALARHPDTSPDTLHLLCFDEEIFVVRGVASNPSTPKHSLDILSRHYDETVRFYVASHKSASEATLKRLFSDQSHGVAIAARQNLDMRRRDALKDDSLQDVGHPEEAEPSAPRGP